MNVPRVAPLIVAMIVVAAFCIVRHPFPVGVAQDDGLYVVLAKSLISGRGLHFINLPGAPADVHYPPGYPVFLAMLWSMARTFPANTAIFALANIVLLGTASAAVVVLARRAGLPQAYGIAAALAGFLMPPALWMGTALLSEPLWLALTFSWLLWAESAVERPRMTATTAMALGVAAGGIMLVRSQAVAAVVALLCVLALRRRWQAGLLVLASAVLCVLPWQLWIAHHAADIPAALSAKYGPYSSWYVAGLREFGPGLILAALRRNVVATLGIVGGMFALPTATWLGIALVLPPTIAAIPRLARKVPVTLILIVVHAAIVLIWPYEPRRFVWTSWPFITLWLAVGLAEMHDRIARRGAPAAGAPNAVRWRVARALVLTDGLLLSAGAVLTTAIILRTGAYRAIAVFQARRIETAIEWVRHHADPAAVVASEDETALFLYAGHLGVPTSTFSAAAYARNDEWSAQVFTDILRRYSPDVAIVSWTGTMTAALDLSKGPQPMLQLSDSAGPSAVFTRVGSRRAIRE